MKEIKLYFTFNFWNFFVEFSNFVFQTKMLLLKLTILFPPFYCIFIISLMFQITPVKNATIDSFLFRKKNEKDIKTDDVSTVQVSLFLFK